MRNQIQHKTKKKICFKKMPFKIVILFTAALLVVFHKGNLRGTMNALLLRQGVSVLLTLARQVPKTLYKSHGNGLDFITSR